MKRLRWLVLLFLLLPLWGQNTPTLGNNPDQGPSLPATCVIGQTYFKTTATIGLNMCTAANTWSAVGTGGGTGTVTSIATTSPITGGTITTTGTIACATCATTSAGGTLTLDQVGSPGAAWTTTQGNFPITHNFAQTTNSQSGLTLGETSAATGGSGNNQLTISTAANSTSTLLNLSQGAISSVFPTAAINLLQGSNTGATNVPGLNIAATWNNSSLVGVGVLSNITCTAAAANSNLFDFQVGGTSFMKLTSTTTNCAGPATLQMGTNGIIKAATLTALTYEGSIGSSNVNICGGACTSSTNAALGGNLIQGSDNSNNGSAATAGYGIFRGGILTNATPNAAALQGATQLGMGFLKGSAVAAVGSVVCGTTTAFTVTDCSHTGPANNVVGIATSTTNPIGVVGAGQALVKTDGAVTIGDNLCMGTTTDGQAHDNGTTACALGTSIGVVIATTGTITQMSGATTAATAMSTTLPLVQLHIAQ